MQVSVEKVEGEMFLEQGAEWLENETDIVWKASSLCAVAFAASAFVLQLLDSHFFYVTDKFEHLK